MVLPVDVIPLRRCLALLWRLVAEQRRRGREVLSHGKGDELLINSEAECAAEPNSPYDELIALQALAAKEEEAEAALPHCCGTPCSPSIALTTAVFVMGAATLACAFPSVTVVFGLLGSTTSVTCMIFYPALMLQARAAATEAFEKSRGRLLGDDEELLDIRFFTPKSPAALRALAWALHALSLVLILLGTSAYVFTTWF
jgi:hypothetical protein